MSSPLEWSGFWGVGQLTLLIPYIGCPADSVPLELFAHFLCRINSVPTILVLIINISTIVDYKQNHC